MAGVGGNDRRRLDGGLGWGWGGVKGSWDGREVSEVSERPQLIVPFGSGDVRSHQYIGLRQVEHGVQAVGLHLKGHFVDLGRQQPQLLGRKALVLHVRRLLQQVHCGSQGHPKIEI